MTSAQSWIQSTGSILNTLVGLKCQVIANSTEPLDTNQDWVQGLAECAVFHVEHGKLV